MIRVLIETANTYITFKNADRVTLKDEELIVYVGCKLYTYELSSLITYEIRKDNYNNVD